MEFGGWRSSSVGDGSASLTRHLRYSGISVRLFADCSRYPKIINRISVGSSLSFEGLNIICACVMSTSELV